MATTGLKFGLATLTVAALTACGGDEAPAAPATGEKPTATAAPRITPVAALKPETREFRDWRAVCDNGNRCAAYAGSDIGAWVMVRRDAGPGAAPVILAGQGPAYGEEGPPEAALTFDGKAVAMRHTPEGLAVPAAAVMATLTRLAGAREVRFSVMDEGPEISVSGASAALLWIDERQGRLDTVDAMIRRGARPAASARAAQALPLIEAAPAVAQGGLGAANGPLQGDGKTADIALPAALEALPSTRECRAATNEIPTVQKAVMAARLGPQTELWGVPCSAGAYNVSYALYLTGPGGANPRPAAFPTWRAHGLTEGDQDWLTNPVYDPATRTISHFPRGRGIGDCGVIQTWTWTGRAFALKEEKSMGDCWGMGQDRWPTSWRTQ